MMLTNTDPVVGWEAISPTNHPIREERKLIDRLWTTRDALIEAGETDQDLLQALARLATHLTEAKECTCMLPEQSCPACTLSAHAVHILQEMEL